MRILTEREQTELDNSCGLWSLKEASKALKIPYRLVTRYLILDERRRNIAKQEALQGIASAIIAKEINAPLRVVKLFLSTVIEPVITTEQDQKRRKLIETIKERQAIQRDRNKIADLLGVPEELRFPPHRDRGKGNHVSCQDIEKMETLYMRGWTRQNIVNLSGFCYKTVYRHTQGLDLRYIRKKNPALIPIDKP
jgi:hypothetical protein